MDLLIDFFPLQGITGTLEFLPGERYKHILVNITDNSIPELEKAFKVELLNPDGAGKGLWNNTNTFI